MPDSNSVPSSISLIGMPGCGKSTVGVILAKLAGLRFVDTDLDIQAREQDTLQNILEQRGYRELRAIEQAVLLDIDLDGAVIATGGSAVYSAMAMRRLQQAGPLVYLETELEPLEQRVAAAPPRGIASDARQSYSRIFTERAPLYRQYANLTLPTNGLNAQQIADTILTRLQFSARA